MTTEIASYILTETSAAVTNTSNFAGMVLPLAIVVGFTAAVTLGSVAWYNSKRPLGWENKERPEIVPEVPESENPGLGTPQS